MQEDRKNKEKLLEEKKHREKLHVDKKHKEKLLGEKKHREKLLVEIGYARQRREEGQVLSGDQVGDL